MDEIIRGSAQSDFSVRLLFSAVSHFLIFKNRFVINGVPLYSIWRQIHGHATRSQALTCLAYSLRNNKVEQVENRSDHTMFTMHVDLVPNSGIKKPENS